MRPLSTAPLSRHRSIGVDVLEWKKAGFFYGNHRDRLGTLLHPNELTFVKTSAKPPEAFALIFSAKEAVFKALGASFMGVSGFREIQLFPMKNFSFRLSGRLRKNAPIGVPFRVSFKKTRYHVVASCAPNVIPAPAEGGSASGGKAGINRSLIPDKKFRG